jgi:hypothetical protein
MAMKYKNLLLIVSLNLLALIALAVALPHLMISPGKTMQAHAEIADDCFACHTPFIGSSSDKCIACHRVSEIGLKTTKGKSIGGEKKRVAFHRKLIEEDCVACHSDHNGVMAFRPISRFTHELVSRPVREHCEGCHANPGDALHRKIKGNCNQCHTIEDWNAATFDHDEFFRFDRHHPAECESCHIGGDYDTYTCYGCHEHSRSNIREEHFEEGIFNYENCVECHRSGDEDEAEWRWRSRGEGSSRLWGEGYREKEHEEHEEDEEHEEHEANRRWRYDD